MLPLKITSPTRTPHKLRHNNFTNIYPMPISHVFYSWQSDLPDRTNKGFIQKALEKVAQEIKLDTTLEVEPVIDRDTLGEPGSPDITGAIFNKIDHAAAFVADVSIVCHGPGGRPVPNPNVLIELGYALKALSAQRIVIVFNLAFGQINDLPFDLRSRRILTYQMAQDDEPAQACRHVEKALHKALIEILQSGSAEEFAKNSRLVTELVSQLVHILSFGEEATRREIDPWIGQIADEFKTTSRWLRNATASNLMDDLGLSADIESLASLLDIVGRHQHTFGDGDEYIKKILRAVDLARLLRDKIFQNGPIDDTSKASVRSILSDLNRRLNAWIQRIQAAEEVDYDLFNELLAALVDIGFQLEQISYYPISWPKPTFRTELRALGQNFHLIQHDHELGRYGDEESILAIITNWHEELRGLTQLALS